MARVIQFEIRANDPERARRFYQRLFGWEFTRWEGPQDYWLVRTGNPGDPGIDGGLMPRVGAGPTEGAATNCYVCVVEVTSVDTTAALVPAIGGQLVVPKMPVPGVGFLAYAKDPEGNIFGVLQRDAAAA